MKIHENPWLGTPNPEIPVVSCPYWHTVSINNNSKYYFVRIVHSFPDLTLVESTWIPRYMSSKCVYAPRTFDFSIFRFQKYIFGIFWKFSYFSSKYRAVHIRIWAASKIMKWVLFEAPHYYRRLVIFWIFIKKPLKIIKCMFENPTKNATTQIYYRIYIENPACGLLGGFW